MKVVTVIILAAVALTGAGTELQKSPGYSFERQRLWPGFDGKMCKVQPVVATDWRGTALLTYQKLLLSGSDVFYGQYISKSVDDGKTWSEPKKIELFNDTMENGYRMARYASVRYSRQNSRWYALGVRQAYSNDRRPNDSTSGDVPQLGPLYVTVDADKGDFIGYFEMPFPFKYSSAMPFGDPVEVDGELIVPFYFIEPNVALKIGAHSPPSKVVCVRYRFGGSGIEVVKAGVPISCPQLKRGVGEPSLVRFRDRYYLTLRSDERGMFAVSEDGLTFGEPKEWTWLDGTPIGNRNTQQHWLNFGGSLYLAYTREDGRNGHVFRNRAPIYTARFDPVHSALDRGTEFALVPELGARLGNFCTISSGDGSSWLVTAEWMQPVGCERYGSDNSLWLSRMSSSTNLP